MKILIAPDSFKECLSAFAVTEALSVGLRRSGVPDSSLLCRPLADGGEGFLDVLHHALGGEIDTVCVSGPMGNPVSARYGLLDSGRTAVIEMAEAAGVHLLPVEGRNPGVTTTRGVGELIKHVLDLGVQRILVGLGGSVTNDGGTGMAAALGACFKDADGKPLAPGGAALHHLVEVDLSGFDKRLQTVEVVGACDVLNTLCGDKGASFVYGPQKGASPKEVQQLDEALYHYAAVVKKQMGVEVLSLAGGGAAGGLAAGLALFAGATLRSGAELVFEAYGDMEESIGSASIIISGEGAVDGQSAQGKVVAVLAKAAKDHGKPLLVVAGKVGNDLEALYNAGVTAVFPIAPEPMSRSVALEHAREYLEQTGESFGRLINVFLSDT